jgi:antitoxin ParD1/3/4/toxin ParE1/3/4
MARFVLARAAEDDLLEIGEYIAATQSPARAAQVLGDLQEGMHKLAETPGLGHQRPDLTTDSAYRFWRVHTFLIVYRAGAEPLAVARILRGARDVATALRRPPA